MPGSGAEPMRLAEWHLRNWPILQYLIQKLLSFTCMPCSPAHKAAAFPLISLIALSSALCEPTPKHLQTALVLSKTSGESAALFRNVWLSTQKHTLGILRWAPTGNELRWLKPFIHSQRVQQKQKTSMHTTGIVARASPRPSSFTTHCLVSNTHVVLIPLSNISVALRHSPHNSSAPTAGEGYQKRLIPILF
jgi:hypothetical protein